MGQRRLLNNHDAYYSKMFFMVGLPQDGKPNPGYDDTKVPTVFSNRNVLIQEMLLLMQIMKKVVIISVH